MTELLDPWEEAQAARAPVAPQVQAPIMEPWEEARAAQGLGSPLASSGMTRSATPSLQPQDWISKTYHPLLEGGAMTAAGILASPTAPETLGIGPAAASIAAYPIGQQAANWIDQSRGIQSAPQGIGQSLQSGAEIEAGGRVLSAAIGAATPAVKSAIIKSISSVFGPSTEAINAWLENPSLPNTPDVVTLARKLPQTLNNLKGLISQASEQAGRFLSDSPALEQGAIPKTNLLNLINKEVTNLETSPGVVIGSANQVANDHLNALQSSINKLPGDYIPQTSVKSLIKAIDNNINFADRSASSTNSALANIRDGANKLLKSGNPKYATAMKEISGMMGTLEDTQRQFGITNEIGQGLQPTDRTITALNGINKATKSISQDTLNDLSKLTGDDYISDAQNAKYAKEFKTGFAQGSRRTILGTEMGGTAGAAVGGFVGHPVIGAQAGGMLGGFTGAAADKFGGPMAGVAANLIRALAPHMPVDLATRIVSSVFAPQSTPQGQIGNGQ